MATIGIYSVGSISVSRTDTGGPPLNGNPISNAVNGNAFSWENPSDLAMTFGAPNASINFADSDGVLESNPISNNELITDQRLEGTTTIDGTTYAESPNDVLWATPPGTYVRAEYSVTLYDAAGKAYTMLGVTITSGYAPLLRASAL